MLYCGSAKKEQGGTVTITSFEQDGIILLSIHDDGVGFDVMLAMRMDIAIQESKM